ncbi:MAG: DUF4411 family protein [Candidatus Thorarchaeota archaeon]
MKYSFDTSGFINPFRRYYVPDVFPQLWDMINRLIEDGTIVASKEVFIELGVKDDDLLHFVSNRPSLFIELDDIQQAIVGEIVNSYKKLVDPNSTKNNADPYVIALAEVFNLTVVSYERPGNQEHPKIPYVCQQRGVKHINFIEFLRDEGYKG